MSRQAGWLARIGLYDDCYALRLPLCLLGLGGPRWALLSVGGVPLCWGSLCRSRLCVGSLAIGRMSIGAIASSYLARGTSRTPGYYVVGASGAAAHVPFVVSFVCEAVGGVSLFSLRFLPPSFRIYFLGLLKPAWFWWCGGAHYWKRVIPGGLYSSRCWGGSPLFSVLSFVAVGHWVIGRPRNGSRGGLLELLLYHLLGFLVLALLTVHSAQ